MPIESMLYNLRNSNLRNLLNPEGVAFVGRQSIIPDKPY